MRAIVNDETTGTVTTPSVAASKSPDTDRLPARSNSAGTLADRVAQRFDHRVRRTSGEAVPAGLHHRARDDRHHADLGLGERERVGEHRFEHRAAIDAPAA